MEKEQCEEQHEDISHEMLKATPGQSLLQTRHQQEKLYLDFDASNSTATGGMTSESGKLVEQITSLLTQLREEHEQELSSLRSQLRQEQEANADLKKGEKEDDDANPNGEALVATDVLNHTDALNLGLGLKFYTPYRSSNCLANISDPVGSGPALPNANRVNPGNGSLAAVRAWLWAYDERKFDLYVQHRLSCSNSLVESAEAADLCFPSCAANMPKMAWMQTQHKEKWMMHFCFEVPLARRSRWWNCSSVCFQPESPGKCSMEVPYLHGISRPALPFNTPWGFNYVRKRLLVYCGGTRRGLTHGRNRSETLRLMEGAASNLLAASPDTIFSSYLIAEAKGYEPGQNPPPFYQKAWELYASANFSWHPYGDTPTRRAVYDSVMFGCVPVIEQTAALFYSRLFNGLLWSRMNISLRDAFVVIPAGMESDGQGIVKMLASISASEIDQRRRYLQKIAPALQWGWNGANDAFLMALGSFQSAPLAAQLNFDFANGRPK